MVSDQAGQQFPRYLLLEDWSRHKGQESNTRSYLCGLQKGAKYTIRSAIEGYGDLGFTLND